ncbi:UDP-4-amino-4,6-dideoxy-N-acetyl-beta-L-altrosamine transaminase [Gammaproteobacteria bacterium]|nr:UDP-4-amino-4,6-dideoxy-N-acetyl-beta-L-altrosamine transaminase [Gammaproteobacteria bacterium]
MIPYGKQDINQQDIDAVVSVLKSDFLTQGPMVPAFEESIIKYTGANHALAVNSATSALHIACLALEVGPGDVVWTSPNTFVASANCALYCGAEIDFVDIDDSTFNMCPQLLETKLQKTKSEGKKLPKVVIPVHMCGQPCDMLQISKLAVEYGFKIIEDASHAIGGSCEDHKIGNCEYSDITVFSFHPVKIITTAEGGVAVTNDKSIASKMALYRGHGITRDPTLMTKVSDGPWYYEQLCLGFNYRMTDLQAALGLSQMKRLDDFVSVRHQLALRYDELLKDLPVVTPYRDSRHYSAFHLYVIRLKLNFIKSTHLEIFCGLKEKGIGVNLHYIPVHMHPYYAGKGFGIGDYPVAEGYYQSAISLPLFFSMSLKDQSEVVAALELLLK